MVKRTDEERRALLEEWRGSGMNTAAWCKGKGICLSTFNLWKRRYGPVENNEPAVFLQAAALKYERKERLCNVRIILSEKFTIELDDGASQETVRTALAAIEDLCFQA